MTAATLQEQARALGDPTRHAIFRHIAEAEGPVDIAELNRQFPLNHNAIRQHVAKLVDAGLVVASTAPGTGRGRPRRVYRVDPAAEGRFDTTGPYERLCQLLVEIIRTGREATDVGRRAADRFRAPARSGDPVADINAAMARQGFDPEVQPVDDGVEIVLHNCPFESAALADRRTVCALHLGIAEGLADDPKVHVDELVANDPHQADCRLHIRVADDGDEHDEPGALLLRRGRPRTR